MNDVDNGEVNRRLPTMPAEIAAAIIKVMRGARQLGFDDRNNFGKYGFVSVDKFLAEFRPMMAEAGLMLVIEETGITYRDGAVSESGRATSWMMPSYEVWLAHESGTMWGPLHRHLAIPMTGPQTFGAAESYVMKRAIRALFLVPSGEKDADEVEQGEMTGEPGKPPPPASLSGRPVSKANPAVRPATPRTANKGQQQPITADNGQEPDGLDMGEAPPDAPPQLIEVALKLADQGSAAIREWFDGLDEANKAPLRPQLPALRERARKADLRTEQVFDREP